jgi:catechol 2,3-dioxygenase-like lactoylglutathione lyase family enzyme
MVDLKLEVVVIAVSDVDRAKDFYTGLGWRLDADFDLPEFRVVQLTPPGSPTSVQFGRNVPGPAGPVKGLMLIVSDIGAAHGELAARGAPVGGVFHGSGARFVPEARVEGRDPEGASYGSYCSFEDPDGNEWLLQEIKQRLPGR